MRVDLFLPVVAEPLETELKRRFNSQCTEHKLCSVAAVLCPSSAQHTALSFGTKTLNVAASLRSSM